MDEHVDFGDISTTSFQSPLPMQPTSKLGQLGTLGNTALFDAPFMSNLTPEKDKDRGNDDNDEQEDGGTDLNSTLGADPVTPTVAPHIDNKDMSKKPDNQTTETPSRQRRIRVNIEVERIIVSMKCILSDIGLQSFAKAKIWSTMGDVVIPSGHFKPNTSSPSTVEIMSVTNLSFSTTESEL